MAPPAPASAPPVPAKKKPPPPPGKAPAASAPKNTSAPPAPAPVPQKAPTSTPSAGSAPTSTSPGPQKGKSPPHPAPVTKIGSPADNGPPPSPDAAAAKTKMPPPASPAKGGFPGPPTKANAPSPAVPRDAPAGAKDELPSAPASKKGPPAPPVKSVGGPREPLPKSAAADDQVAASSAAKKAPGVAVPDSVASSPTPAPGPAVGVRPGAAVRMKTGLVGVGPPPGAVLKPVGKTSTSAPAVVPSPKKAGPPSSTGLKATRQQKAAPPSLPVPPAAPARVETREGAPSSEEPRTLPADHDRLCKIVDEKGQFVGLAHGPPPPLVSQEPARPSRRIKPHRSTELWQLDRGAPEDPLPCASRSTLLRPCRRRTASGSLAEGGVHYLAPFGLPSAWNPLPGFFFPVPAWPPYALQQAVSAYPAKLPRSPRTRRRSARGRNTQLQPAQGVVDDRSVGMSPAPSVGEEFNHHSYYPSAPTCHPLFAYPYYTAAVEVDPCFFGVQNQLQQAQQLPGQPWFNPYPYGTFAAYPPLSRSKQQRHRRRSDAYAADGSGDSISLSPCGRGDDPLRLSSEVRSPLGSSGAPPAPASRRLSGTSHRHSAGYPRGDVRERQFSGPRRRYQDEEAFSLGSLEDITEPEDSPREFTPYSQRRGTRYSRGAFGRPDNRGSMSPVPAGRYSASAANASPYGRTPWARLEKKLNRIRGGYGLTEQLPPERLPDPVVRQEVERQDVGGDGQVRNREISQRPPVDVSSPTASRRRSSVGYPWTGDLPAGYAEEHPETDDDASGDQYYKHFNTRYRGSNDPWVDETGYKVGASRRATGPETQAGSAEPLSRRKPRRGGERWSFEKGCTAPRRRTYQSLNELAAHFSHIEGEDQDELISLLLLCRRLEKQIDEQHLVIDMLEQELTTASATLRFPPEWRALEGLDLVSLVPADSSFQPSAATPLFLKSTVLLPKQLPDGSSPFTGIPPAALVETAAAKPAGAASADTKKVNALGAAAGKPAAAGAPKAPPAVGAGKPAVPGKPASPAAAGSAKAESPSAPGASEGPKPPPPSVGMKKVLKSPAALKKPEFKATLKPK